MTNLKNIWYVLGITLLGWKLYQLYQEGQGPAPVPGQAWAPAPGFNDMPGLNPESWETPAWGPAAPTTPAAAAPSKGGAGGSLLPKKQGRPAGIGAFLS